MSSSFLKRRFLPSLRIPVIQAARAMAPDIPAAAVRGNGRRTRERTISGAARHSPAAPAKARVMRNMNTAQTVLDFLLQAARVFWYSP